LDAYILRRADLDEWPARIQSRKNDFNIENITLGTIEKLSLDLEHRRYCEARSGNPIFDVLTTRILKDGLLCQVLDAKGEEIAVTLFPPTTPNGKSLGYIRLAVEGIQDGKPVKRALQFNRVGAGGPEPLAAAVLI
jgi:hypothetical protein